MGELIAFFLAGFQGSKGSGREEKVGQKNSENACYGKEG